MATKNRYLGIPVQNLFSETAVWATVPDGRSEPAPWKLQYHWALLWEEWEWSSTLNTAATLSYLWVNQLLQAALVSYPVGGVNRQFDDSIVTEQPYDRSDKLPWLSHCCIYQWATWWVEWTSWYSSTVPLSYLMGGVNQLLDDSSTVPLSYHMTGVRKLLVYHWATWWEEWTSSLMTAVLYHWATIWKEWESSLCTNELPDGRSEPAPWWQQYCTTELPYDRSEKVPCVPMSYLMGGVNQLLDDGNTTELPDGRNEPAPWWQPCCLAWEDRRWPQIQQRWAAAPDPLVLAPVHEILWRKVQEITFKV